jgi:hypothetical protein
MDRCIFCGGPFGPIRKRSAEHAAPKWCADLVPNHGAALHQHVVETESGTETTALGLRNPFTTVAGDVCEGCNTGWMHELEESCEALLGHFIQGQSRNIRFWRQALTATWAVKTAMVWECVSPEDRTIPLDVLRMFHRTQRPAARQQVWIGRYTGQDPHSFRRAAAHGVGVAPLRPDIPDEAHAYLVALTVGQLALVVYGHTLPVPLSFTLPAQFGPSLIPIWPPEHEVVKWPAAIGLDDAALEACVRSLGDPIQPPEQPGESQ